MAKQNYTGLLLTAREQADLRLKEKGLDYKIRVRTDEEDHEKLLPSSGLVPRLKKQRVAETEDLLSEYFTTLRSQNMKMKDEVKLAGEVPESLKIGDSDKYVIKDVGKRLVIDLQEALGISKAQAAGIAGNLAYETGDFKFMQELKPVVAGSKGGYGFAQWTGSRRTNFENWAKEKKLDINSYEANFGFLMEELLNTSEGRFLEELENTDDPQAAAEIVSKKYLRPGKPNLASRKSKALKYFEEDY